MHGTFIAVGDYLLMAGKKPSELAPEKIDGLGWLSER